MVIRDQSGGDLICFGVGDKKFHFPKKIKEADAGLRRVLADRLRPATAASGKVLRRIADAAVMAARPRAEGDGWEMTIFADLEAAARRLVDDEKIENPMGAFVAWCKGRGLYGKKQ